MNIMYGLLAVLAAWTYFTYFGGGGSAQSPTLLSSSQATSPEGAQLLTALGDLQNVKLDDAIFSDPVFRNLSDFSVDIPAQPIGRPNPFAPLPAYAGSGSKVPAGIITGTASR